MNTYYAIMVTRMNIKLDVNDGVDIDGTTESTDLCPVLFSSKNNAFEFAEKHFEKQFKEQVDLFYTEKLEHSISYSKRNKNNFIHVSYEVHEMHVNK
jgi:hypothetical protein